MNFLSTVDASLDGLHISLDLASTALLGFVHQGGFSSHSVYTRLMVRLSSDHWVFNFYKVSFQHLGIFAKSWGLRPVLKGSSFWSSLSENFRRRLQICQQNISLANLCASCWIFSFRSIFLAVSSLAVGLLAMSELDSLLRAPLHYWVSLDGSMFPTFIR